MRIVWIAATTLVVFVVWLAVGSDANPGVAFFYAVPIGLTTWWFGGRAGAVAALACCSLYIVGALIEPIDNVGIALAVRALAFAAVVVAVSLARERVLIRALR